MTTHKDEIVERLRALKPGPFTVSARDDDDPPIRLPVNPDGLEAAALIEQQASTIERMEEALRAIAEHDGVSYRYGDWVRGTARAALTNKERMA